MPSFRGTVPGISNVRAPNEGRRLRRDAFEPLASLLRSASVLTASAREFDSHNHTVVRTSTGRLEHQPSSDVFLVTLAPPGGDGAHDGPIEFDTPLFRSPPFRTSSVAGTPVAIPRETLFNCLRHFTTSSACGLLIPPVRTRPEIEKPADRMASGLRSLRVVRPFVCSPCAQQHTRRHHGNLQATTTTLGNLDLKIGRGERI